MSEKILYVYAQPQGGAPGKNTNVVETVERGKVINREVGLSDGLIGLRVTEAWVQNYGDIRFNRRPYGEPLTQQLDEGLVAKLNRSMSCYDIN